MAEKLTAALDETKNALANLLTSSALYTEHSKGKWFRFSAMVRIVDDTAEFSALQLESHEGP
jgi:hypothetical protein